MSERAHIVAYLRKCAEMASDTADKCDNHEDRIRRLERAAALGWAAHEIESGGYLADGPTAGGC